MQNNVHSKTKFGLVRDLKPGLGKGGWGAQWAKSGGEAVL